MPAKLEDTVEVLLKEYPAAIRMLRSVDYHPPNKIQGMLQAHAGWAAQGKAPEHFTLGEAAYSHNQMAYVLVGHMAQYGAFRGVAPLSLDCVNSKKFEKMLIKGFAIDFVAPFHSTEQYTGVLEIVNHRVSKTATGGYLVLKTQFSFMDGKAVGTSKIAINLAAQELNNGQ